MVATRISPTPFAGQGMWRARDCFLSVPAYPEEKRVLFWALSHRAATLGIAFASLLLAVGFGSRLGSEFFPAADTGRIFVRMETPPGTSVESTLEIMKMNERWVLAQPEVAGAFSAIGTGGSRGDGQPTEGVMFIILRHKSERERGAREQQERRGAQVAEPAEQELRGIERDLRRSVNRFADQSFFVGTDFGNGILTVENREQAVVRAEVNGQNKGAGAAAAALHLVALARRWGTETKGVGFQRLGEDTVLAGGKADGTKTA